MINAKFILCAGLGLAISASAIEKRNLDFVIGVNGDFKAAMNAAKSAKTSTSKHFIIFFPDGQYNIGSLTGDNNQMTVFPTSNVSIVGQSANNTVIYNKSINEGISVSATIQFKANDIYMQDMSIMNKAIYGNEANCGSACRHDALMTVGDRHIYKNVKLLAGQDTYYTKLSGGKGRTYWEGGQIEGTVDFICGDGDVFFEGTKLIMRRSGGYITAAATTAQWGYVFNNTTIEVSNSSYNKTFYLGRSWKSAKTVFLNTTMKAEPRAEGWGPNMNSAPQVFGEYNSKNASGGAINTSKRKTYFDGSKDGSTATLKTVWNASDAAKYTLSNVLKGSDNWAPNTLTTQVSAPKISQDGAEIVWANDDNALCWVVFVNGKYKTNVTKPVFSLNGIATGSKITVRAANSMGGLGASSNEVATLDANVTYYGISLKQTAGGKATSSVDGTKVAEGKTVTFTATPNSGWTFEGWSGKSAAGINATATEVSITANADIELEAKFSAKGVTAFQAEEGEITNASADSNNEGFAGTGFVNFAAGDLSQVYLPVFTDSAGDYKILVTYANGSADSRSLNIVTEGDCPAGIDGCKGGQQHAFASTGSWTTWVGDTLKVKLPAGASYIAFMTIGGNDGPNIDQVSLVQEKSPEQNQDDPGDNPTDPGKGEENTEGLHSLANVQMNNSPAAVARLYDMKGQLLRQNAGSRVNTNGLKAGVYLLQVRDGSTLRRQVIQVK